MKLSGTTRHILPACPARPRCRHRTALGAHVDDPVRGLDDIQVVLDDDHRIAFVHQAVDDLEQLADVLEMQTGCRLVENVDVRPVERFCSSAASLTRCASPPDSVGAG